MDDVVRWKGYLFLFFVEMVFTVSSQAMNMIAWWDNVNTHMAIWNRASHMGLAMGSV